MIVKGITSHGICDNCLNDICLPSHTIKYWLENYNNEYISEV